MVKILKNYLDYLPILSIHALKGLAIHELPLPVPNSFRDALARGKSSQQNPDFNPKPVFPLLYFPSQTICVP